MHTSYFLLLYFHLFKKNEKNRGAEQNDLWKQKAGKDGMNVKGKTSWKEMLDGGEFGQFMSLERELRDRQK